MGKEPLVTVFVVMLVRKGNVRKVGTISQGARRLESCTQVKGQVGNPWRRDDMTESN
jgi:hypothetical protein